MTEIFAVPGGYEVVLDLVQGQAGLTFPPSRTRDACLAIGRGLARSRSANVSRYCDLLRTDAQAFDDLVAELTIGETYFLREPAHFEFLRQRILPAWCQSAEAGRPLRIWSAGCATGEEAWSLAIVLAEAGLASQVHILGTDISRASLAKATEGVYRDWSLRGPAADSARRWLQKQAGFYVVSETLRQHVVFAYLNLALDVYPSLAGGTWGMDLIFCRNVLIYFNADTVRHVARRLYDSLAPGGWLFTASSDPPLAELVPVEVVATDLGVFYRRPGGELPEGKYKSGKPQEASGGREPPEEIEVPTSHEQESGSQVPRVNWTGQTAASHQDSGISPEDRNAESIQVPIQDPIQQIHALATTDLVAAQNRCAEDLLQHALSVELHYLNAVLLEALDRTAESAAAARRAIYLDRTVAVAHFTLGVALQRLGDWSGACRAYRNARQLCLARPADEVVPLSEGERAGRLAAAAAAHLAILEAAGHGERP